MKKKQVEQDAFKLFLERNKDLDNHSHFISVKGKAVREWNPQCCHCQWGRKIHARMWKEYFE